MNFKGHLTVSLGIGAAGAFVLESQHWGVGWAGFGTFVGAVLVGGGFPDIDLPSTPRKIYLGFCAGFSCAFLWLGVISPWLLLPWALLPLAAWSGHRGWTHSYFIPLGLILAAFQGLWNFCELPVTPALLGFERLPFFLGSLGLGLGITGHLLADSISPFSRWGWFRRGMHYS